MEKCARVKVILRAGWALASVLSGGSNRLQEITGRKWFLAGEYFDLQEMQGARNYVALLYFIRRVARSARNVANPKEMKHWVKVGTANHVFLVKVATCKKLRGESGTQQVTRLDTARVKVLIDIHFSSEHDSIRATSLDMKGGSTSSNSSTVDLRISPLYDRTSSQSQNSLNSLSDRTNIPMCGVGLRRSSRCLSPLLIPPRSPTASDGSGQSPAPLSPLLGTLQLELYQKKDVKITLPGSKQPEANLDDGSKRLGQLRFQLKYDFDKSDLHVHVIEAVGLAVSNEGGFNDPYIRLYLSPGVDSRKRETSMHRNESSPYFDEHFKFPVSQEDLQDQILILQVFDYDRYSRNDVVGQVSFRLDEFDVTTALEINADVIKNKKPSGERQEILVSLSFLPHAERLGVVLLKARNLFLPPNKETLDPVVKVYLVGGGKRLKKKKTTPRRNTQDPVWNESVAFSISAASLANASLEICVLDQYSDLRGNTKAQVGRCILGPRENGSELAHWQDMRKNKNGKGVAMWHVLT
ncbi:Synaptotagmin-1 [Folsomia candida]|uniref:Synaptotagmin-1 n=1 Tax=Folsomia candida TaxID=158441 RepID=A0A226DP39_FOLCA|nr:Synaptotagmin-1 [Folsomia candida]